MPQRERTQNVVITGGGAGIGRAAARKFAADGARIALLDVDRPSLDETCEELEEATEVLLFETDVSQAEQVKSTLGKIIEQWGAVDVVCANAGINGQWAPLDELEVESWQRTLDINLNGSFYTVKYALPGLKKRGGAVVVTASINGVRVFSNGGATAYSASKAGQTAMAQMLALELAKFKIRVNVVCPGAIDTEIEQSTERRSLKRAQEPVEYPDGVVPLLDGGSGSASQVADLIHYLASPAASLITGAVVTVDGAESLLQG